MISSFADFASTVPVLAYLDPGSGSMVLQALFAGALSCLFFFRTSVTHVKGWLLSRRAAR